MAILKQKVLQFSWDSQRCFFGSFVLSILKLNNLSYPVILHFDAFRGVDFIGDMTDFRGIWASRLFITIINAWLGETLFSASDFFLIFSFRQMF